MNATTAAASTLAGRDVLTPPLPGGEGSPGRVAPPAGVGCDVPINPTPAGELRSPGDPSPPERGETAAPLLATGLRRWVYLSFGMACLVLATIGAFAPILPCTPWVLAASYFFDRSSPWFNRLLRRSPYFGHILRDWDEHRGIRPWVKATVAVCVTTFMTLMAVFTDLTWWAKGPAVGLAAVGVGVVLFVVPTVRAKVV